MTNLIKNTSLAAVIALLAAPAFAQTNQITPEQVVESLEGQGYTEVVPVEGEDANEDTLVATAVNPDGVSVTIVYNKGTGEVVSATAAGAQAAQEAAEAPAEAAAEAAAEAEAEAMPAN
ncbi:MAG: hypothetical protein DI616_13090 [Paracoccus denitrificans]|uniref:PepSY domain-containing protein n=1 Tax=Paracoccus denitrificans TaxID=266 RepID=A0A533I5J0_PARDE|nr:MAG: hypothetical protein DI616_13090 [Paracoccus denitrificans]